MKTAPRKHAGAWLCGLLLAGCYRTHERPREPAPRESACGVALLGGSPAPMPGYCPSRANRSIFAIIDDEPVLRWRLALPEAPGTDSPIVVGPEGRLYITVGSMLIAVDDAGSSGEVAWRSELGAPASAPVLVADGSVLVILRPDVMRREALWLTALGAVSRRAALPDGVLGHPLVGQDGALYFAATDPRSERSSLVALEPDGALRWSREVGAVVSGLALGAEDQLVAATYLVTDEISPVRDGSYRIEIGTTSVDGRSGEERFRVAVDRDGAVTAGPALGPDGSAWLVAWIDGYRQSALVAVAPDGTVRRTILADPPIGGGPSSLAVGADGLVVLKEGTRLLAYDALGALVWQRDVHLNIDLGGTLDPAGGLLLNHALTSADDGTCLWVSHIPAHREGATHFFPGPMVVGDGVLYSMASDTQLWAVGPP
ncbi:MAG: hypothetical protein ACK6CU_17005 [Deltaproteobacteria bacterium]|jgi:outer membrane protein assembly factor BamB